MATLTSSLGPLVTGSFAVLEVAQSEAYVPLHLHVTLLDGTCFDLAVSSEHTVGEVKDKIAELDGTSPEYQALLLGSRRLDDSGLTLAELQVPDNAKLTLVRVETAAPFLRKFWQQFLAITKVRIRCVLLNPDSDSDTDEEVNSTIQQILEEMEALARKSFEHHDKNGDGVLDKEEAAVFFLHVVEELSYVYKTLAPAMTLMSACMPLVAAKLKLWLLEVADGPGLTPDDISKKANGLFEEIGKKVPDFTEEDLLHLKCSLFDYIVPHKRPLHLHLAAKHKRFLKMTEADRERKRAKFEGKLLVVMAGERTRVETVSNKRKEYTANKEVRDAAAFAFLDVNNDGTLSISEVLAAFVQLEGKRNKFYEILGIDEITEMAAR